MMRRPRVPLPLVLLVPALVGTGCSTADDSGPVEVRVRNASTVVMHDVVIGFPEVTVRGGGPVEPGDAESGEVGYGTIDPGEVTPYRTIAKAYRYAAVTVTVDGQDAHLVPIDYVGEDLLEAGRYTYELHYEGGSFLGLTLVRD